MDIETSASSADDNKQDQSYLDDNSGAKPADASPAAADGNTDSSSDNGALKPDAGPKTPLEAVQMAMAASKAGDSPAPGDSPKPDSATQLKPGETAGADTAKDDLPPFHNHPRFKEIVAENAAFREKVTQFEALREPAENFKKLDNFLTTNHLDQSDFENGLKMMTLMKNDPEKALEALEPYYQALLKANGKVLPEDIQQKLEAGLIDQDTATAMSVDRARNAHLTSKLEAERNRQTKAEEERQRNEVARTQYEITTQMTSAVTKWETEWGAKDVDYPTLMPLVRDRVAQLARATPPKTPEDAVKLAEDARKQITQEMGKLLPRKKPITTGPTGGGSSRNVQAVAKTGLDVVRNAIAAN